jgi:hypothetical protein
MKKHVLITGLMLLASSFSFGQTFTQAGDNSGFTTNCDLDTEAGKYIWGVYAPGGGGGQDATLVDVMTLGWGATSGDAYLIFEILGTDLDLSAVANQKISCTLKSVDGSDVALPLTYVLKLQDASNVDLLDGTKSFAVTGTATSFTLDFSGTIASGKNLSAVHKVIWYYPSFLAGAKLYVSNLKVGSYVVSAGTNNAQSLVTGSKLYPNPTNGLATVELNLVSNSNVKVVLNDMLGKEVKVITEQSTSTLTESFDVSGLNKGIYSVVYMIDGAVAKTQMLVIN